MKRLLTWLILALSLSACSSSLMGPSEADTAELDEMKRRILELQRKAAVAEVELERLRQKVADLEAAAIADAPPAVETRLPVKRPIRPEPMPVPQIPESTAPTQLIEESDLPVESVSAPDPRPAVPGAGGATVSSGSGTAAPPDDSPTGALAQVGPAAQAVYDQGYTLHHQGRYLDAEAAFQRFLQGNPNTDLSDNAQYWIGESRYARGDLRGALAAFRETRQRYPEGNKVADALVKEGDCLKGLGDLDGARDSYREVMRSYPDSAAALMAEERLAGVD